MPTAAGWDYREWGAEIVVTGHQHTYEDIVVDGPGPMRLTATPETLILEYHQPVGGSDVVIDVITLDR